jgi:hypothetical protein
MRLITMLLVVSCLAPASAAPPDDAAQLARDAYIFGYPLVIMGITEEVWLSNNRVNEFDHLREFPDYTFREVVRPNADTLYSLSWMELGNEPVILSVPDTGNRYYLMQLVDAWTNTFAAPGTRTTGNKAGRFAIVGPKWNGQLPQGITVLRSPTNMVWLIGRIQTNTASDYAAVRALQDQFRLAPLSAWGKPPKPTETMATTDRAHRTPSAEMETMDAATFFARLCRLMQQNPPVPADAPLVRQMERLGIKPGGGFDFAKLPAETRQEIERGVAEAKKTISGPTPGVTIRNGWRMRYHIGTYGADYLLRAQIARIGLGANLPKDALYPVAVSDSEGRPFDGNRHYVVHFDKDLLPPVNAFWSLTMYDSRGFFTENAVGRYAIGDRDQLRYNADGSLDIYIQHSRPGAEKESNWLPAPVEPFSMELRLYWPKPQALDGSWTPPPVRAVD